MIKLTRLNGSEIYLNPLLIESIERTPDTIVTLSNGHKYVIIESPDAAITLISDYLRGIGFLAGICAENSLTRGDAR